jgi:DNA-binding NtrC family response regulator
MCDETGASRGAIQHVEGCTFGMLAQFAKPRFGPYTRAVLVVDDQAYIRKSVARMLGMHLTVPVIPLRPVAVGWWIRRTPLAVLSDLHMDPYYGRDLGVLAASLGVPFALMSGSATFAPGVAEDLGVPYVRKPFVPGEPYATVSALLGQ